MEFSKFQHFSNVPVHQKSTFLQNHTSGSFLSKYLRARLPEVRFCKNVDFGWTGTSLKCWNFEKSILQVRKTPQEARKRVGTVPRAHGIAAKKLGHLRGFCGFADFSLLRLTDSIVLAYSWVTADRRQNAQIVWFRATRTLV